MTESSYTNLNGRRLIAIGAGDLGREVCTWFPHLQISGFLDSGTKHCEHPGMPPILGTPEEYQPRPEDIFLCTVGNPRGRLAVTKMLEARGARFATAIHPTALVPASSSVGAGSIILPYSIVDINTHLGEHCVLYFRAGVGHDAAVGDGCVILSNAVVGSRCTLAQGVLISTLSFCNTGISIGAFAQVGANSFAARDVPAYATALGVPARIISPSSERVSTATAALAAV